VSAEALLKKLGMKPERIGRNVARPDALAEIVPLPDLAANEDADVIVAFVTDVAGVEPMVAEVLPRYCTGAALWFAYPKKSGSIRTDISRDHGWEPLAMRDMLPVTQVAIDADWSALRFRRRDEIKTLTRASDLPGKRPCS